jgi:hypothetical protein
MRYGTLSAIGGFTALTEASTDYLRIDAGRCTGGDDAPLRTTVEDAPGDDGALILPAFDGAQIITLGGDLIIKSATDLSGYITAEDTLLASLKSALHAMKATPDDLVWSGGSVKVWKYAAIDGSRQGMLKGVTFSVIVDVFA